MSTAPLLAIGTFGTHIVCCSGIYSFTGTVPEGIKVGGYASEQAGIAALATWFKAQDTEFQRAHIADLRNDVFSLVMAA